MSTQCVRRGYYLNQRSTYLAYSYIVAMWFCLRPDRFVLRRSAQAFSFSENSFQIFLFEVICQVMSMTVSYAYKNDRISRREKKNMKYLNMGQHQSR